MERKINMIRNRERKEWKGKWRERREKSKR